MKKGLLAIIAILCVCAFAEASDCRRVVRVQHAAVVQHHAHVVQEVAIARFVEVPVYSASYAADHFKTEVQRLQQENEILRLQQRVQALESGIQPQRMPQADPQKQALQGEHPGVAVLKKSCVACHDASTAKKGGGVVFFEGGNLMKLNDKQALSIVREIYSGRMPKGSKITDEDVGAIMGLLDSIK